uniref:Uncharacterized protein n=1 Tax=Malurus cyaneus samueli TaxID=2593467 RepID=A0A8C5U6U5_9PASS
FPSLYKAVVEIFRWFGPFGEHAVNASWIAVQVTPEFSSWGVKPDKGFLQIWGLSSFLKLPASSQFINGARCRYPDGQLDNV